MEYKEPILKSITQPVVKGVAQEVKYIPWNYAVVIDSEGRFVIDALGRTVITRII